MTDEQIAERFQLSMLPHHMRHGVVLWLKHGVMTGHFLTAVMENNLAQSFGAADAENTKNMRTWASWLWNCCPTEAWGSEAKVDGWRKRGGLLGHYHEDEHAS